MGDIRSEVNADRLVMLGLARGMGSQMLGCENDAILGMTVDVIDSLSNHQCRNLVAVGAQLLSAAWMTLADDEDGYNMFMDDLWKQWSDGSS